MSPENRSFSNILENIVANIQRIIRSEVRLAKTEVQEEAVKAGKAAGIASAGAVLAFYAVGFFLLTGVYALETALPPWLSALIIAVVVTAVAVPLLFSGMKRMKRVNPRPDKTIHTMKENLEWAKDQAR